MRETDTKSEVRIGVVFHLMVFAIGFIFMVDNIGKSESGDSIMVTEYVVFLNCWFSDILS